MDLSWIKIKFLLNQHGWKQLRQEGSHTIWERNGRHERIAVGHGHSMGGGGLKEILKRFEIDMETLVEAPKVRNRAKSLISVGNLPGVKSIPEEGTFGRRLFDARVAKGMSQAQLSTTLNVSQGNLSAWERNKVNPFHRQFKTSKEALARMAAFFGWEDLYSKPVKPVEKHTNGATMTEEKKEEKTEEKKEESLPIATKGEQALSRALLANDIYFWAIGMENKVRKLENELKKYENENLVALREKATKYDEMKRLLG
jgi:transcriptional regulator with XRE-family HTH domain/predicted RNA binding protein YcfA (HicA-like mRNA interferase family)